jgi:hypothetical protein
MNRSRLIGLLMCAAQIALQAGAARTTQAVVLYDMTWDGAQLYNDPTVSFPTRTPQLVGTELQYGTGAVGLEKFLQIPLATAGSLPATGDIVVTVNFQVERGTSTFIPNFMFNDGGQRFIGLRTSSKGPVNSITGDGLLASFYDLDGNNTGEGSDSNAIFFDAQYPSVGGILEGTARYILRSTVDDNAFLAFGGKQNGSDYLNLNRNGPLSFSYWPTTVNETGSIHSLSIKVEQVPEPAALVLAASSAFGLLAIRRRLAN